MNSKELRHMSRTELLQMLLLLVEENDRLKTELKQLTDQLNSKSQKYDNANSLAKAALQISGVFEDAEAAAQQYLQHIQELSARQNSIYQETEAAARKKAQAIISEANAYKAASIREANEYWHYIRTKVRGVMEEQSQASSSVPRVKGIKKS